MKRPVSIGVLGSTMEKAHYNVNQLTDALPEELRPMIRCHALAPTHPDRTRGPILHCFYDPTGLLDWFYMLGFAHRPPDLLSGYRYETKVADMEELIRKSAEQIEKLQ